MTEPKLIPCVRCGRADYDAGWFEGSPNQGTIQCNCVLVGGEPDVVIEWWNALMVCK